MFHSFSFCSSYQFVLIVSFVCVSLVYCFLVCNIFLCIFLVYMSSFPFGSESSIVVQSCSPFRVLAIIFVYLVNKLLLLQIDSLVFFLACLTVTLRAVYSLICVQLNTRVKRPTFVSDLQEAICFVYINTLIILIQTVYFAKLNKQKVTVGSQQI